MEKKVNNTPSHEEKYVHFNIHTDSLDMADHSMQTIKKRGCCAPLTTITRNIMKKRSDANTTWKDLSIQEKISDMNDDLMTVLESYMDEMDTDELFYNAIKFMTTTLYDCAENHRQAFKILKISMDEGIKNYMDKKEH